jgi:hypothetical protein
LDVQDSLPPDLKVLWLDHNQIQRFQQTDINYFDGLVNRTSLRLKLGHNPYSCSCDSKGNSRDKCRLTNPSHFLSVQSRLKGRFHEISVIFLKCSFLKLYGT